MTEQSDDQKKLENLQDRMNKLSGDPSWRLPGDRGGFHRSYYPSVKFSLSTYMPVEPFDPNSRKNLDFKSLSTQERFDVMYIRSYGKKFREFIQKHGLEDTARYYYLTGYNDHECWFSIGSDNLDELSAVVDRLEGELRPEFQKLMRDMFLAANLDAFDGSAYLRIYKLFGESILRPESAGEIIKKLCLVAADQADPSKAEQAKQILQEIAERTPALEPVINAEQPKKHAQPSGAEAERIIPQSKERK